MPGSKEEKAEKEVVDAGVTETEEDDEFGAAFGEAAAESSTPDTKAEAPAKRERAEEEPEEKEDEEEGKDGEEGGEEDPSKSEKEPTETDTGKPKKGEDDWEQRYKTLQGMFEQLQGEVETLKKGKTDPAEKDGKKGPDKTEPTGIDLSKLAEEDPDIKEFLEEYDYLAGPLQKILSTVASPKAASVSQEELAAILHNATITAARPEYPELTKKNGDGPSALRTFVDGYNGEDKERVQNAYEKGSAQEVIWLIDQYKASRESKKESELSSKVKEGKKKKLEDLSAVEARKEASPGPKAKEGDSDSFEAGFEASAGKK